MVNQKLSEMAFVAFKKRTEAQLATSFAIQWENSKFRTEDHREWIQPLWLGFSPRATNGETKVRDHTAQVNCFAHMGQTIDDDEGATVSSNRIYEIVDEVMAAFRYETIDILDYDQSGDPKVAEMTFLQPTPDNLPPESAPAPGDYRTVSIPAILENL